MYRLYTDLIESWYRLGTFFFGTLKPVLQKSSAFFTKKVKSASPRAPLTAVLQGRCGEVDNKKEVPPL